MGAKSSLLHCLKTGGMDGVRWTRETEDASGDAGEWIGVLCRPGRPVSAREHARAMECSLALSLLDPPRGSPANLQKPYMLFP